MGRTCDFTKYHLKSLQTLLTACLGFSMCIANCFLFAKELFQASLLWFLKIWQLCLPVLVISLHLTLNCLAPVFCVSSWRLEFMAPPPCVRASSPARRRGKGPPSERSPSVNQFWTWVIFCALGKHGSLCFACGYCSACTHCSQPRCSQRGAFLCSVHFSPSPRGLRAAPCGAQSHIAGLCSVAL